MPRSAELNRLIFRISTTAIGISFSVRLRRVVRGNNLIVVMILFFSVTRRSGKGFWLLSVRWKSWGCVKASVRQKVECKNKEGNCPG